MRLWSIHPSYLDAKGLVALWREGLLARKVLSGQTKGYRNHPQLTRFKVHSEPLHLIDMYLAKVLEESVVRGYSFDSSKINLQNQGIKIPVTDGQIRFEMEHLRDKLQVRDTKRFAALSLDAPLKPHPIFKVIPGPIEIWEKI